MTTIKIHYHSESNYYLVFDPEFESETPEENHLYEPDCGHQLNISDSLLIAFESFVDCPVCFHLDRAPQALLPGNTGKSIWVSFEPDFLP